MRWFFVVELIGKTVLLLSVALQLSALAELQASATDIQIHAIQLKLDWLRHYLESGAPSAEIGWLPGHEFWVSPERRIAGGLANAYVIAFLAGTVLTIVARAFEIRHMSRGA